MQIGIVGSDGNARLRAGCYARRPDVTVAGVVAGTGREPEWATAPVYSDLGAMLTDGGVDAVDVCDGARSQSKIVDRCLDAGAGVVCRTPLADGLAEAESIRAAADRGDCSILVDARHRFARENVDAKSLIDSGEIGATTTVRTTRRLPGRGSEASERTPAPNRLVERALYPDVARIRWLFGDVDRVFTRLRSGTGSSGEYRHAVVVARLASGAVGHLEVSYGGRHDQVTVRTEYSGTEGRLTYDSDTERPLAIRSRESVDVGTRASFERPRPSSGLHDRHAEHLVACLRGEADPVASPSEAVATLRTVRAAGRSARRGGPVDVAEVSA